MNATLHYKRQRARRHLSSASTANGAGLDYFLLILANAGLPDPVSQAPHVVKDRKFVADYFWPGPFTLEGVTWRGLVVERDGGTWSRKSGHSGGTAYVKDRERDHAMLLSGLLVLRFTPEQLDSGSALPILRRVIG